MMEKEEMKKVKIKKLEDQIKLQEMEEYLHKYKIQRQVKPKEPASQ